MPPDELNDDRTTEDLDKLADSTDVARNTERPMSEAKEPTTPVTVKEEYEFVHNGKPVKANREQVIKWAQQGYDYPQKAQRLNQERAKWEESRQKWEKDWGVYKQIDDYAKGNSDWWNFVQQNWQTRGQAQPQPQPGQASGQPDPYAPKFQQFEQKLSQIEPVVGRLETYLQQVQEKEEDTKLETEIKSIREQHKDLDWASVDETGKSLELRVLEHAQANGIPTFKAAFRDLLHDDLLSKAQAQAKLAVSKGIQQRTKLGVLGESPTPKGQWAPPNNKSIRQTSYEELEQDIREELRSSNRK